MAFVVVYDACVLFPQHLRDLLIRVAQAGVVQAKWTERILDEAFTALANKRPDLNPAQLVRTRDLMGKAIRDVEVTGYEPLIDSIEHMPDANDRHVVAAAIRSHAQVIVTNNTRDFPPEALDPYDIDVQTPDVFLGHVFDLNPDAFIGILKEMVAGFSNPPMTVDELLDLFAARGLPQTVENVGARLAETAPG